ncbi:MAG: hypothetical protein FWH38_01320 [Treponema sp.]|nr:hypothetical protein [Treponema sp.]
MKKSWMLFPAVLMLLAGMVFVGVLSCGGDDDGKPVVNTYTGTDGNYEFTLKITDNATYVFLIDGESVSTGTVSKSVDGWVLAPNSGGDSFEVTVDGNKIIGIEGEISPDDGSDPVIPGTIIVLEPVAGVWEWYTSDDSKPNGDYMVPQTIFEPGGASRITNALEGDLPFEYPAGTEILDSKGNQITGPVYNFTGNTKVSSANRPANQGAQFPLVGWEAVPADEETLEILRTARGYSFWVRLNSSTAGNWSFLTAVVTDFQPEKGYEYKHYFGNRPGDSRTRNFTSNLQVGTWYKITVVMDVDDTGFNMDEDGWLYNYPPTPDPKKPFNQDKAERIQWQIPLQHQVGAGVTSRSGDPYDMTNGSYDFDLDFYGLELIR